MGGRLAVKRFLGIGRSRVGRFGLAAGVVVATLVGLTAPAYAHHAIVSGSSICANNDHVITWSIGNNQSGDMFGQATSGRRRRTHVPRPGVLVIVAVPWCRAAMLLTRARPSPTRPAADAVRAASAR